MSATPATLTNKLNAIQSIKADIKRAIENKGVTVDGAFDTYHVCIDSIETGGSDELAIGLIQGTISGDVEIPDGVTQIGPHAFMGCTEITSVTIPSGVTTIHDNAFETCSSMTSVTIPNSVTRIGSNVFNFCNALTSVTIPDSVTSLGNAIFYSCASLTSVRLPSGITSIPPSTFNSCYALTSFTIPDGVTSIGDNAFANCGSLTSITIPNSVTSIEGGAFSTCYGLTSFTIPSGVTSISGYTFTGCSSLTSFTIHSGITSIGEYAFQGCPALSSVTIENNQAKLQYNTDAFAGIASDATLYVPEGLLSEYQADSSWTGAFAEIRAIGGEPAAYTITGVSTDQGNVDYKEMSMQYGETDIYEVTFFGTGLTNDLDYANIINVEYSTEDFSDFHFDDIANVADNGTWISLNYQYTTVNAEEGLTSSPSEVRFTCGEYSGTINACIFKVKNYEWDSDNTDTVNNYPNTINATAIVNLGHCNVADNYLTDDAKNTIAQSILQIPTEGVTYEVANIEDGVHMIDENTGEYHITVQWTITAPNANEFVANLQWGSMTEVQHTFATPVHISQFTLNDAIAVNGDDWVHLTKNENNAFVLPQVGPSILLPLSELNDGVNMWDDTVTYSVLHEGANVVLLNDSTTLEPCEENGTLYQCVRINTNSIWREQLFNVWSDTASALPLKITVEINSVSQDLNVALGATDMALPTGCTQITAGISNKFSDNDIDTYRFIDTNIVPTKDTIVKADLGLQHTYGNNLIGNQGIDDYNDWRLFAQGNIESPNSWNIYFDYGSYYDGNSLMDVENRIEAHVEASAMVDENNNPKRLSFTISNGKLEILSNGEQLVNMTGATWDGNNADQMQPIHIWDDRHSGGWEIDIATMYDVKIYESQAGVERNAPLMHVIPVTVNDETKLFDMVTRQYLDIQTFVLD